MNEDRLIVSRKADVAARRLEAERILANDAHTGLRVVNVAVEVKVVAVEADALRTRPADRWQCESFDRHIGLPVGIDRRLARVVRETAIGMAKQTRKAVKLKRVVCIKRSFRNDGYTKRPVTPATARPC